jgi:hypothetical protein
MSGISELKSEITLTYANAGVRFVIEITPPAEREGNEKKGEAALRISVKDTSGKKGLTFTDDCSPVLVDFIGGFVRWLSTLGITADYDGGEINGSFHADYDAHKLIQASGAIAEMLEQRFSLYPHSILT